MYSFKKNKLQHVLISIYFWIILILLKASFAINTSSTCPYNQTECYTIPESQFSSRIDQCQLYGFNFNAMVDVLFSETSRKLMEGVVDFGDLNAAAKHNQSLLAKSLYRFLIKYSSCLELPLNEYPPHNFLVISKCPESFNNSIVIERCEHRSTQLPPLLFMGSVPLLFRNIYCVLCHNVSEESICKTMVTGKVSYHCEDNNGTTEYEHGAEICNTSYIFKSAGEVGYCNGELKNSTVNIFNEECIECLRTYNSTYNSLECLVCKFSVIVSSVECTLRDVPGLGYGIQSLFDVTMYTKRDNYVFTTNDRCQDNEKFDDIFQKCRRFFCPPGRFHYEGDCHDTNTTVYVTGKSQPLANGTNDLYISMNYRQLTRASLSEHSLESIICLLSSYLRLTETYIQIPTYVSRIQKTAVIVYDITASSIKYFLDAVDSLPLSFSSFEISLSITNFDEQGKYNFSCSRGTFACIRNASLKVQNEIIFAEVNVNNITLFYPLANTIINLRISSRNPVIIAEELCVCVPQFGTSLNCTSRLYSYQPNEYLLKESGILDIPKLGISFTSLEYYIEDSQAIVCYDSTKFKHFFDMDLAQTYLSWVCSGLSIFFLLITISLYATIAELRNLPGKLTIGLAVTLILGQGLLMIPNVGVKVCRYLATISHISWLSAFLWMSAQAVNMLFTFHPKSMRVVSQRGSDAFMKYCLFCVLTPVVFCIMLLVLDVIPGNHLHVRYGMAACSWMSDYSGYIFTFFLPVALVLGCNLVCFVVTLYYIEKTMKQSAKMTGKKRDRDRCVIYIKLSSVMGFSWIFGFIASYTNVQALWYVYIILNGLQGMFIFLSFSVNTRTRGLLTQRISASRFFNVFRSSDPPPTSTTATTLSTHL